MAFVAVTPDHIDVALHAAFALHAGKSALRLLLLLFNCSHTNLEPLALIFYFIYFLLLFILVYFILFYYILLYFNIYLLNEEEEREWREWPPTFRSCDQRSVHPRHPRSYE